MHFVLVIPARVGSSRLPGKPLRRLCGEPLIQHTVRQAIGFGLDAEIVVATDDERVRRAVAPLGVDALLTSPAHRTGTERVAEVVRSSRFARTDVVVNLQGDEPFLPIEAVTRPLSLLAAGLSIATAAGPLDKEAAADPHRVKVSVDRDGHALWFARDARELDADARATAVLHHVGVYAYTRAALLSWARPPAAPEERRARLEQLRPLVRGMTIGVARLETVPPPGIDTIDDLRRAETHAFAFTLG